MSRQPPKKKTKLDKAGEEKELKQLKELEAVQQKLEKINNEVSEKILEIEREYDKQRIPIYKERAKILAKIDGFWAKAFVSHPVILGCMTDEEMDAIKYLQDVDIKDEETTNPTGFTITLTFKKNPYFENTKLVKKITITDSKVTLNNVNIKWKPGKQLTKKKTDKKKKKSEDIIEELEDEGFFKWLESSDGQTEIAEVIREDLWPNPVEYYKADFVDDEEEGDDEEEAVEFN